MKKHKIQLSLLLGTATLIFQVSNGMEGKDKKNMHNDSSKKLEHNEETTLDKKAEAIKRAKKYVANEDDLNNTNNNYINRLKRCHPHDKAAIEKLTENNEDWGLYTKKNDPYVHFRFITKIIREEWRDSTDSFANYTIQVVSGKVKNSKKEPKNDFKERMSDLRSFLKNPGPWGISNTSIQEFENKKEKRDIKMRIFDAKFAEINLGKHNYAWQKEYLIKATLVSLSALLIGTLSCLLGTPSYDYSRFITK